MGIVTIWHGSDDDLKRLREAADNNCTCVQEHYQCGSHRMLTDQRLIDHMAFVAWAVEHGKFDEPQNDHHEPLPIPIPQKQEAA